MKCKRVLSLLLCTLLLLPITVQARDMQMYVSGTPLAVNIENVDGFDMVPVLDIADSLGFHAWCDGKTAIIYNDAIKFTCTLHSPAVFDDKGKEYGLEVVPQMIRNRFMIPANFFTEYLGMSYKWDYVTDALFLNSDDTYNWLIDTEEYQKAKLKKDGGSQFYGTWQYKAAYSRAKKHNIKLQFYEDGTCYYETWRVQARGIYEFITADTVVAYFDIYFKDTGKRTYDYYYTEAAFYEFRGDHLVNSAICTDTASQETNKIYYRK